MSINEAIEEFLESDYEIKASNAAKKALAASKRYAMFNPTKLLTSLSPFAQAPEEEAPYDPYQQKADIEVFKSESSAAFTAALLLHNFTAIECLHDLEASSNREENKSSEIYILAKSHSNQLYKMTNDLASIEKWISIDHEITLLTKANGYLLIQDEYADFYLIKPDFNGD